MKVSRRKKKVVGAAKPCDPSALVVAYIPLNESVDVFIADSYLVRYDGVDTVGRMEIKGIEKMRKPCKSFEEAVEIGNQMWSDVTKKKTRKVKIGR